MTAVTPGREALLEAALRKLAIRQGVRLASGGGDVPNGGRCVLCKAEWDEPFKGNEWHQNGCLFDEGARLAAKPADEGVSVFMPPGGDVTVLGKEYLDRRVSSMTESVDREQWRQEDGEAARPEYWIGRLHEAKIALNNLTQGLERRGDSFGRAPLSTTGAPKP